MGGLDGADLDHFGTPNVRCRMRHGGGTTAGFGGSANWPGSAALPQLKRRRWDNVSVIPAGGSASLTFQLWIGAVSTPFTDVLNVRVDGTIVASLHRTGCGRNGLHLCARVDVGAFANGASHAILLEYIGFGGEVGIFSVDHVSLVAGGVCPIAEPRPPPTGSDSIAILPTGLVGRA